MKLLLLVLVAFSGCTQSRTIASNGKKILRLGNGAEPQDLDPQTTNGFLEFRIIWSISEGLVTPDPKTAEPRPGVAESWKISKDGKKYTFKIRDNAKWSNGDPITAEDFVFSYKRQLNPKLGAEGSYFLYPLKNAEEYNKGKITDFSKVGVKAIDSRTLEFSLRAPTPYLLSALVDDGWYPIHPATILKFKAMDVRGTAWTRPGNFVGNGPFKLVSWEPNKVIAVERNPYYWDAKNVKLDRIEFYPVEKAQTEEKMFITGALDKTSTIAPHKIETVKKENPNEYFNEPYLSTYFLRLNIEKPQLRDVRVRRALALAIDRKAIVEKISKAGEQPAYAFTPPHTGNYTPEAYLKYDPSEARRLMAEAGYPDGRGFQPIEFLYNTLEINQAIAETLQQMWKVNLGIKVTLKNTDWKVYLQSILHQQFEIARAKWAADYPDPSIFLNTWITGGGDNGTGFSSKNYDSLINEANSTNDQKKRMAYFGRAEKILMTELPIIPIYTATNTYLLSSHVKNWYPNNLDLHPYQVVDLR